jgi:hypothetical protein
MCNTLCGQGLAVSLEPVEYNKWSYRELRTSHCRAYNIRQTMTLFTFATALQKHACTHLKLPLCTGVCCFTSQVHRLESYVHVMGSSKDTSNGVGILDPVTVAVDCVVTYIPLHPTVRHISCQVLLYSTANYTQRLLRTDCSLSLNTVRALLVL